MADTSKQPFFLTTTLPYVNAKPHIGHAVEFVRADAVARYKQLTGYDVFFNTGTDEHGVKIYEKAQEAGVDPQQFVDDAAENFKNLLGLLHMSPTINFIRTTDQHHTQAAQEFWRRCRENGDIDKKLYKIKYCVDCELEKTDSELNEEGRCVIHPNRELEIREEENYFFKFSRYADKLLELYDSTPDFVVPDYRLKEIRRFVEQGLEDFSISRLKEKMPWGVEVPDDPDHVMYVWFDALVNYVSCLGWPESEGQFEHYWVNGTPTQYAGKDNLRQQAAMWQAMLMSAGLPNSRQIIINGFITSGGQKMSKSLGNVIDPVDMIERYGAETLRYYLVRHVHPFEDSDFTEEKFVDDYNANLANGLGNLVARTLKMYVSYEVDAGTLDRDARLEKGDLMNDEYREGFTSFELNRVADDIWRRISELDEHITKTEPFKTIKTDEATAKEDVAYLARGLFDVAILLEPLMPETARAIQGALQNKQTLEKPLFPRIQ